MSRKYGVPCANPGKKTSSYPFRTTEFVPKHSCIFCKNLRQHICVPSEPPTCAIDGETCEQHSYGAKCPDFIWIKEAD